MPERASKAIELTFSKTEREDAKRVIEERLRRDREEKDRLIGDLEKWLEERREK